MYTDRFIRPINPDIYDLQSRYSQKASLEAETDVVPYHLLENPNSYRETLCEALYGIPLSKILSRSIFAHLPSQISSPFTPPSARVVRPPLRAFTLGGNIPTKILDAPEMSETVGLSSRLIAPLDTNSFLIMCTKKIFSVRFSNSSYTVQEVAGLEDDSDGPAPALSHITVLDAHPLSTIFADATGHLFILQEGKKAQALPTKEPHSPITDIFSTDPFTFVFGNRGKGVSLADLRAKELTVLNVEDSSSHLAAKPGFPYLALGSCRGVRVFDIRSTSQPLEVKFKASQDPVTALAWHPKTSSQILFTAIGGKTPTLSACRIQSTASYAVKTYGIVSTILCSHCDDTLVTPRENRDNKTIVLWKLFQDCRLQCADVGISSQATTPSCGAMEKQDQSFIVAFPDKEFFASWTLVPPVAPSPTYQALPPNFFSSIR